MKIRSVVLREVTNTDRHTLQTDRHTSDKTTSLAEVKIFVLRSGFQNSEELATRYARGMDHSALLR